VLNEKSNRRWLNWKRKFGTYSKKFILNPRQLAFNH
jgi:hypothetical protein